MTTIQHAYCVELDQVVTAREARREYLAREATGRWRFWCDHPGCRAREVRVTCANYWRSASDEETYVAPHYRHLDKHLPGCTYEEGPDERPPAPGGDSASVPGRGSKASDLIDIFDPGDGDAPGGDAPRVYPPAADDARDAHPGRGGRGRDDRSAESKTSFVEDLVDMRNDLRANLPANEFDATEVAIRRGEKIRLVELFKHVRNAWEGKPERVWYGGCKLVKPRFGLGFKLEFLDKLNGHPVILYVDKDQLEDYRFKRSLLDVIDSAEEFTYLTAYVWATLRWDDYRGQYEIDVLNLKHLAIYPGKRVGVLTT